MVAQNEAEHVNGPSLPPTGVHREDFTTSSKRSTSASESEKSCGLVDSGSEDMMSKSESDEVPEKKLISKPILEGKTFTTILYEVVAGIEEPIAIKYFQIDNSRPRSRDTRFKIECHLNDKIYGTGEGSSKKAAKQLASKNTLDRLLEERPSLREDVAKVRKGYPTKKKVQTRRRRIDSSGWNQERSFSDALRPSSFDRYSDMTERRRLAIEFEAVNRMVADMERLASYVGFDDMSPYERSLTYEHPEYYGASDFERALIREQFERSLYGDMQRAANEPDTFEFMRKMQARASRRDEKPKFSKLNAQAAEFMPKATYNF